MLNYYYYYLLLLIVDDDCCDNGDGDAGQTVDVHVYVSRSHVRSFYSNQ